MALFELSPQPFWSPPPSPLHCPPSPPASPAYAAPLYFMPGPVRTEGSNPRANPLSSTPNPPRPPNAWILYRSDKLKDLPPPPPGMPRRPQADISKTVSSMWKSESPDVRAHYERLSDIKKAEHQALYPGYRFQPMKKADKDRLRAERLAERERERGARKSKPKTRAPPHARSPPHDATSAPQGPSSTPRHPTPPPEHPTPRATPPPPAPTPSLYPASPATPSTHPPLLAPQPAVPQRPPSPSDWEAHTQHHQQPPLQDSDALWALPDLAEYPQQEYLTVPLPTSATHPLGWSPADPSPPSDLPFFLLPGPAPDSLQAPADPLHAVLTATADPYTFDLGNFDVSELFDGSREIEVSMGANMSLGLGLDGAAGQHWWSLLADLDQQGFGAPSQPQRPETVSSLSALDSLAAYSFDQTCDAQVQSQPQPQPQEPQDTVPAPAPFAVTHPEPELEPTEQAQYIPPAGAANSSTRRVAADWRRIRLTTPESA